MDHLKRSMIEALQGSLGIVTSAIKQVGISRSAHYVWMRDDEDYKKAVEEVNEMAIDFVESQLYRQISDGQVASTIFFLKTKAKHRGYVERDDRYTSLPTSEDSKSKQTIDPTKLTVEQQRLLADIQLQLGSRSSQG